MHQPDYIMTSRRTFLKTSALAGAAAMASTANVLAEHQPKNMNELFELRIYTLKDETQQKLVEDYWENAAIPTLNKLGISPVGVFTELKPTGQTKIIVLIPFKKLEDFLNMAGNLDKDSSYQQKAAAYLNAPATEPAYERIESSLLRAFNHFPQLELPGQQTRIFELRQYQSASESAGKKKIEMFNDEGEIDVFKRLGFKPVFYAETLIGTLRPNLTYMLTFDDMAGHDSHWKAFGSDPEWKKISSVPDYSDAKLVSKITSTFLAPVTFSQV